ncbi:ABC transporter ATP-binding protein [Ferrovibrio xuzhouensis]|uniref:ABC transporter ATP-binding protein n=1 Tax=Ferrovibrio xuzhouensis TaxID=1576914 RepID=A0ABV7VKM3_9PROT
MQAQAATLDVEHLMKVFDRQVVVRDVSFSLQGGELLTLLGPSGSGKTTTMRMIAGFEEPTGGDVRVAGESIVDLPVHKRDIGVVFQQYALFPHLSVFRNLAYPLEMRGLRKAEIANRVERALAMVRLEGFAGRLPKELSGGQQQRVALARAIVFEPRLLLMDEPMGALDKRLRELMQIEIRQLQQQLGITTVSVTHDQIEALVMSDLIAVLDGGVLQQLGPPLEVYQKPVNRFVADFLGESNLIDVAACQPRTEGLLCRSSRGLETLAAPLRPGEEAASWLVVRPENIQIGDAAAELPNHCRAGIREVLYVGDLLKYRVETETGEQFSIKALASAGQPWRVGDTSLIGWRTEHCLPIRS